MSVLTEFARLRSRLAALKALANAKTPEEGWNALERFADEMAAAYAGLVLVAGDDDDCVRSLAGTSPFFVKTIHVQRTDEERLSDPAEAEAPSCRPADDADDAMPSPRGRLRAGGRTMRRRSGEMGVGDRTVLPLDIFADDRVFAVALGIRDGGDGDKLRQRLEEDVALVGLATRAHAAAPDDPRAKMLTPAEIRVLSYLALGSGPDEIAAEEGKAVATVRHQIASAKRRLGARTTIQAVVLACELGLIGVAPD